MKIAVLQLGKIYIPFKIDGRRDTKMVQMRQKRCLSTMTRNIYPVNKSRTKNIVKFTRKKNLGLLIIIAGGIQISRPKWIQTQEKLKLQTEKVSEIIYDDLYL